MSNIGIPKRACALALTLALTCCASHLVVRAQPAERPDDIRELLLEIEKAIQSGEPGRYLALMADSADPERARVFADVELRSGATRAVIQERDRQRLAASPTGSGYRVLVDGFVEYGARARAATWRFDVRQSSATGEWRIADQEEITSVEGLYRLSLNPTKQLDARDLTISADDFDLSLPAGHVFVADTDQGVTALVLLGSGEMRFHPKSETERGQVRIFCGKQALESRFDAAFIRINPGDLETLVHVDRLYDAPVNSRAFRRAEAFFREESPNSFGLDLADLSRDTWSLLPSLGDFLAEIRTRRFGTLTYAHSNAEPEDITLFDRKHHRNISIYPSEQKLARHGRFYNEDDLTDYDILDYNIDLAVNPDRLWLDGRARVHLKVRSFAAGTLTLRLADPLVVHSIVSDRFGRLFGVRIRNQNSIVINLPTMVGHDEELTLTVSYSGRLEPQTADRETAGMQQGRSTSQEETSLIPAERSFLYSNRSYWYPQGGVTHYATAMLRLTVPAAFDCVASGDLAIGSPELITATDQAPARKVYTYVATQPQRYLAFIVSRFVRSDTATIALTWDTPPNTDGLPPLQGVSYKSLSLSIETNPRQTQRAHEYSERAADIVQFYASIVGDCPYPSFTLALVESERPGGHSPAYFAALNQPLPSSPLVWRNDPETFSNYPEFYLAHELAHQWWGHAVGWRNYHEQWISEGFAQYFAALYAQRQRGDEVFTGVLRQLRKWGMSESDQGPVYLGYRLGHIRGEPRVFSALVYNKSAAVLHMLRRLVGDEAFFRGLRRFYRTWRFRKAGTEDFRLAMEAESQRSLGRFFERWIYGSTLPRLKFSHSIKDADLVIRVEQLGEVFDVPLTVRLRYYDKKTFDVLVPVTDRVVEQRVHLDGTLKSVDISKDDGTMAEIIERTEP